MDRLIVKGSNDKPEINLDRISGVLYLGGSSLPENVTEVYQPVLDWIDEYVTDPNLSTRVDFFFEYLNTSSSHMIMRILEKVIPLKDTCREFNIYWYFVAGDVEMFHFGQELTEMSNFPIQIEERDI